MLLFLLPAIFIGVALVGAQPHHEGVNCYDCSGHGPGHSFPDCLHHKKRCHGDEVCQVNYNGGNNWIHCRPKDDCTHDVHSHAGSFNPLCQHGGAYTHGACQVCCGNDACVDEAAKGITTAGGGSLWDVLKGECKDQLDGTQCPDLTSTTLSCGSHVALRLCPSTCNLCSLFGNTTGACRDTVAANGCPALQLAENVCNTSSGTFICPVTCHQCDKLLDAKIAAVLANPPPRPSTTAAPATTAAAPAANVTSGPMTSGTTPDPLDEACSVLASQTCDVMAALCKVVTCPAECAKCDATTTAVPTTTMAAPCEDSLQNTKCADVTDVCTSTLLASYCQKFCNAC